MMKLLHSHKFFFLQTLGDELRAGPLDLLVLKHTLRYHNKELVFMWIPKSKRIKVLLLNFSVLICEMKTIGPSDFAVYLSTLRVYKQYTGFPPAHGLDELKLKARFPFWYKD